MMIEMSNIMKIKYWERHMKSKGKIAGERLESVIGLKFL